VSTPSEILRGDLVRLDALRDSDAPAIATWQQSDFLRLYDAVPAIPRSESEIVDWIADLRKNDRTVAFAIRPSDGDQLLGTLELDEILWPHRVCGIGLAVGDPDDWGRGYGTEAAELGLSFAFDELNLYRVTATVFEYNERSIALIERLGFRREGVYRQFIQRDGTRYDMILYGLLQPEWENQQNV